MQIVIGEKALIYLHAADWILDGLLFFKDLTFFASVYAGYTYTRVPECMHVYSIYNVDRICTEIKLTCNENNNM